LKGFIHPGPGGVPLLAGDLSIESAHRGLDPLSSPQVDPLAQVREKCEYLFLCVIRHRRQHPLDHVPAARRDPYTHTKPRKLLTPQDSLYRPQPLVTTIASARSESDLPNFHCCIVHNDEEVRGGIEPLHLKPGAKSGPAPVHVSERFEQNHLLSPSHSLCDEHTSLPAEATESPIVADSIDDPPTYIVSGRIVLRARIAQPRDDLHRNSSGEFEQR
jgi:hypothetical protein